MIATLESRQLTDREISARFNARTKADNERRRQLGIEAILRAEVDQAVAAADDTPERNPRQSKWSENEMDWTWAFIARPVFVR